MDQTTEASVSPAHTSSLFDVTFGYAEGSLGAPWFRAYKKFKRQVRRAGLSVRVELRPVTEIDSNVDVLILPSALNALPASLAVGEQLLVGSLKEIQPELDRLTNRLLHEERFRQPISAKRTIAVHQGFRPVTERGRSED